MVKQRRRLLIALTALFLCNILVILFLQSALAASYRQGSTGQQVTTIQKKLIRWGYLEGKADGIFGAATRRGVIAFQQRNGLTADGIVGRATLNALGMNSAGSSNSTSGQQVQTTDTTLLARVISAEARGEPYAGQVAVGAVILNRMEHPSFPATLAGVVYQPGAFTCMVDGQIDQPVSASALRAAQEAMNGADPSGGAIYYFNPNTATSSWIWSRELIKIIGNHRFCS